MPLVTPTSPVPAPLLLALNLLLTVPRSLLITYFCQTIVMIDYIYIYIYIAEYRLVLTNIE